MSVSVTGLKRRRKGSSLTNTASLISFQNRTVAFTLVAASLPECLWFILTRGLWLCLLIFAKFLGPAEVVVWASTGAVWSMVEETAEAIAGKLLVGGSATST